MICYDDDDDEDDDDDDDGGGDGDDDNNICTETFCSCRSAHANLCYLVVILLSPFNCRLLPISRRPTYSHERTRLPDARLLYPRSFLQSVSLPGTSEAVSVKHCFLS